MQISVLAGGPSNEREISLTSGRAVAAALKDAGHVVHLADITPDDLSALDVPCDVIFPTLHGAWGESGELQAILEAHDVPFVGSGSAASRLGMNKVATKLAWQEANLPTPAFRLVEHPSVRTAPGACVIKPVDGGSSIDTFIRKTAAEGVADIEGPVSYLVARYGRCMVEQFIDGYEMTVGILFERALPPIWIDPGEGEWFDYQSKYSANGAAHRFELPPAVATRHRRPFVEKLQTIALEAHQVIGCRDLSRVDFMIDRAGKPYLLEINTMPGFTGRSLLPDAAREAGIDFADLCDQLVRRVARRDKAVAA